MRPALALIVLGLNAAAIVSVLGSRRTGARKVAWIAAVVLLPLVGAVGWFATARRR